MLKPQAHGRIDLQIESGFDLSTPFCRKELPPSSCSKDNALGMLTEVLAGGGVRVSVVKGKKKERGKFQK